MTDDGIKAIELDSFVGCHSRRNRRSVSRRLRWKLWSHIFRVRNGNAAGIRTGFFADCRANASWITKSGANWAANLEITVLAWKMRWVVHNRPTVPGSSDWLTAEEAAHYLKVKARTLLLWVRQGKVKGFALSGTKRRVWRFRQPDLDAALLEAAVLPSVAPSVRPAERMNE